ncbi:hypothetical protein Taro_044419, partial [Colocasia esculenta]|nr:hypothetical protein [Colocasia esculenta]
NSAFILFLVSLLPIIGRCWYCHKGGPKLLLVGSDSLPSPTIPPSRLSFAFRWFISTRFLFMDRSLCAISTRGVRGNGIMSKQDKGMTHTRQRACFFSASSTPPRIVSTNSEVLLISSFKYHTLWNSSLATENT